VTQPTVFDHVLSRNILQNEMGCFIDMYTSLMRFVFYDFSYF